MAHNVAGPSGVQVSCSGSTTSSCPDDKRHFKDILDVDESEFESGNSEEEGQYENEEGNNMNDEQEEQERFELIRVSKSELINEVMQPVKDLSKMVKELATEVKDLKRKAKRRHKSSDSEDDTDREERRKTSTSKQMKMDDDERGEFEGEEEVGEDMNEDLARWMEKRFLQDVKGKRLETRAEKYKMPGNAMFLKAPKTNPEVWKLIKNSHAKQKDAQMMKIQDNLAKAAVAVSQVYEKIGTEDQKTLRDGLALIGQASKQISYVRRDRQRYNLPFDSKNICNKEVEVTQDFLYGNQAGKVLKEVQESFLKSQRRPVTVPFKSHKNYNYQKPSYQNQNPKFPKNTGKMYPKNNYSRQPKKSYNKQ